MVAMSIYLSTPAGESLHLTAVGRAHGNCPSRCTASARDVPHTIPLIAAPGIAHLPSTIVLYFRFLLSRKQRSPCAIRRPCPQPAAAGTAAAPLRRVCRSAPPLLQLTVRSAPRAHPPTAPAGRTGRVLYRSARSAQTPRRGRFGARGGRGRCAHAGAMHGRTDRHT